MKRWWLALVPLLLVGWQVWPFPGPGLVRGGGTTPVTQYLSITNSSIAASTTTYYGMMAGNNAAENQVESIMLGGTISALSVKLDGNIGTTGAHTMAVTLRVCPGNSACADSSSTEDSTPLTCTVTGASSVCSDSTHHIPVTEGDRVTLKVVTSAGTTSRIPQASLKWVGTNSNESMIVGSSNWGGGSGTNCMRLSGLQVADGSCDAQFRVTIPTTFTATKLFARMSDVTITAGCARITLRGAFSGGAATNTSLTFDLTNNNTFSDLAHTQSMSALDRLEVQIDPGTTCGGTGTMTPSTGGKMQYTVALTNTSQKFAWFHVDASNLSTVANTTEYQASFGHTAPSGTATSGQRLIGAVTATDMAVVLSAAPGASSDRTFNLRDDNAASSGPTSVVVSGTNVNNTSSTSSTIGVDTLMNYQTITNASVAPAGAGASIGLAMQGL